MCAPWLTLVFKGSLRARRRELLLLGVRIPVRTLLVRTSCLRVPGCHFEGANYAGGYALLLESKGARAPRSTAPEVRGGGGGGVTAIEAIGIAFVGHAAEAVGSYARNLGRTGRRGRGTQEDAVW
jgi:hypothetical protein